MVVVSYEILTKVRKTFTGKVLRGYRFRAQIIITGMTEHNFHQLKIPVDGSGAFIPVNGQIKSGNLTKANLKIALIERMDLVKLRYEKLLQPLPTKKKVVNLTAAGVFKEAFST